MKITLIITTYNWHESLSLVLKSVSHQIIAPDEIIIADDGSDYKTKDLINNYNKNHELNILHSWQEDKGFRAARSRNKAILLSSGEYIVLIDGDTILHPSFVKDHIEIAEYGYFVQGSRVLISELGTQRALVTKNVNSTLSSNEGTHDIKSTSTLTFIPGVMYSFGRISKSCPNVFRPSVSLDPERVIVL